MTLTRVGWLALFLVVGCGGNSHPVCPSEKHLADPDGHGERCVDDRSTCDAPSDCVAQDACCTSSCVDDDGSSVYECAQSCRSPECADGTCAAGWVCQAGLDECSAYCVPDDLPCEDGWILGDPNGTGVWQCIRDDSTCSRRSDCPDSANGCCVGACSDQGGGQYACTQDCGGAGEADRAQMWECTSNEDCENMMGQPGWTCEPSACNGNECLPPVAECTIDDDCVLATDPMECCMSCANAYSLAELAANQCLVPWANGDPPQGEPGAPLPPEDPPLCEPQCGDVLCAEMECVMPLRAGCSGGQCVPVYE